jgi:hypothetical protein
VDLPGRHARHRRGLTSDGVTRVNPAVSSLEVIWAFVIEDLVIPVFEPGEAPRHLILTGPNGTGKSSILLGLSEALQQWPQSPIQRPIVEPTIQGVVDGRSFIVAYLPANRSFEPFLQYLAREGGDEQNADAIKHWFDELAVWLRKVLQQRDLELRFNAKTFQFYLWIDGHEVAFDTLPDGFASILTLWSDILLRTVAVEGEATGFVLIDEPELHLHPEAQKELLPLLTQQFPSLQFIVATHSPLIATSLTHATLYDLERREASRSEDWQGIRYGNVLESHFGLRTDFLA